MKIRYPINQILAPFTLEGTPPWIDIWFLLYKDWLYSIRDGRYPTFIYRDKETSVWTSESFGHRVPIDLTQQWTLASSSILKSIDSLFYFGQRGTFRYVINLLYFSRLNVSKITQLFLDKGSRKERVIFCNRKVCLQDFETSEPNLHESIPLRSFIFWLELLGTEEWWLPCYFGSSTTINSTADFLLRHSTPFEVKYNFLIFIGGNLPPTPLFSGDVTVEIMDITHTKSGIAHGQPELPSALVWNSTHKCWDCKR